MAAVLAGRCPSWCSSSPRGRPAVVALIVGMLTLRLRDYSASSPSACAPRRPGHPRVEQELSGTRGCLSMTADDRVLRHVRRLSTILVAWLLKRYGMGWHWPASQNGGCRAQRINVVAPRCSPALSAILMAMAGAVIATRRSYVDPASPSASTRPSCPFLALFGGMHNLVGGDRSGDPTFSGNVADLVPEVFMPTRAVMIVAILSCRTARGVIAGVAQDQGWMTCSVPLTRTGRDLRGTAPRSRTDRDDDRAALSM